MRLLNPNEPVKRFFSAEMELREAGEDGSPPQIRGFAAVYNTESQDLGGFVEVIHPGFFDEVLTGDTRALFNHDRNFVLGRTVAQPVPTLRLMDAQEGLAFQADGPWGQTVNDIVVLPMRRGDIDQCSFAFYVKYKERGDGMDGDTWAYDEARDLYIRHLLPGGCRKLPDVSVVTYPAYEAAQAEVNCRDLFTRIREQKEINLAEVAPLPFRLPTFREIGTAPSTGSGQAEENTQKGGDPGTRADQKVTPIATLALELDLLRIKSNS